jgi:hypothetical protein
MKHKVIILAHEFVESIPDQLKDETLYVCMTFGTAAHKCCCGCGREVITPIGPTDWQLLFDGEFVSLDPSIGNWSFACQSHYWIRQNRVLWAPRWEKNEIEAGRAYERSAKEKYFNRGKIATAQSETFWQKIKRRWFKQ